MTLFTVALLLASSPTTDLTKLNPGELIAEYRATGLALTGTRFSPWNAKHDASPIRLLPDSPFPKARAEILHRGKSVVSELLGLLRDEVSANRPRDINSTVVSLADDIIDLLVAIGDPRAVPSIIEVLEKPSPSYDPFSTLAAVERLTFCAMKTNKPTFRWSEESVRHTSALAVDPYRILDDRSSIIRKYKDWLAGEGKDPTQWLGLAQRRAHNLLKTDHPDDIYLVAEFLRKHGGKTQEVATRIAEVLDEMKLVAPNEWAYRGKTSTMPIGNFCSLLSRFGKVARPHARTLIRIQMEHGDNAWSFYAFLRDVGGDEVIAHMFSALPRVSAEVAKIKADPKTPRGFRSDDPRLDWIQSLREIQLTCDRWAGRRFDSDADRLAWWEANRRRSRPEWLAENLELVVKQADAGEPWAVWLAREILPELPKHELSPPFRINGQTNFRTDWFNKNRSRLKYDPDGEAFRLSGGK